MEFILNKLLFISKLNNLNDNLMKSENIVNKKINDLNVNEIKNNSMKLIKISVKCDVNEDKQRQCYKQLKCFWPKCRYNSKLNCHLNKHISHHLNKRQFVCEDCNKQFNYQCDLIAHKNTVHFTEKSFMCSINNCNKKFKNKLYLIKHERRHSPNDSYKCDDCDKKFKIKNSFISHRRYVHSNYRPFVCPRSDCNKRFKTKFGFRYHRSHVHSTDRPFQSP